MTPEESSDLKIGDRVRWQDDAKDQGEVVGRDSSGVQIKWDRGSSTYYYHNDMQDVTRLPTTV
jgi:hypothetical protein